ncbi:MAG: chemotaxis protein CheA [Verrucomicrobiota bacterium]
MNEDIQKQLVQDFVEESLEGLERFDQELLALENGASTGETLNNIFRIIHTVKGTSGCLGLTKIESLSHVGENLLVKVRDGELEAHQSMITTLLTFSDALQNMMASLSNHGNEGDTDHTGLKAELERLLSAESATEPAKSVQPQEPTIQEKPQEQDEKVSESKVPEDESISTTAAKAPDNPDDTKAQEQCWGLYDDEPEAEDTSSKAQEQRWGIFDESGESDTSKAIESEPQSQPSENSEPPISTIKKETDSEAKTQENKSVAEGSIRVDVNHLDRLMNLVGELVLSRNQIVQRVSNYEDSALQSACQRLNLIATELQEGVMKTRMQPIGNVWQKFPRVVRDVSLELSKKVRLDMVGKETDLDRTLIEAIKDPLTHIVRNAIDHGIETPAERANNGKSEEGILLLRAYHEGGQVNIEIIDDGKGIDPEKIKLKAVEKALISHEEAGRMNDRDAFALVFQPGFSTAPKVTNLSGRGVGMDVVKTNIEKIGGSVDIQSEFGQGTTIKIKIPLTLAIIPALIVTSASERFAIPQVSLLELVRLDGDDVNKAIEFIDGTPVYRLRGNLLPLVYLNKELKIDHENENDLDCVNIVVLKADGRSFGLIVDEINDTEEIVVKPLAKQLKGLQAFAGATIMGDGHVALILDVLGLAQHAHVITEVGSKSAFDNQEDRSNAGDDKHTMLLFEAGDNHRLALPLSLVDRLEEFDKEIIEHSGESEVVQYRGQILPLIRVQNYVNTFSNENSSTANDDTMQVVVYSENGRSVGLIVGNIKDIVEESLEVKHLTSSRGLSGSAVIQDHVTDLLDVRDIIAQADPDFFIEKNESIV